MTALAVAPAPPGPLEEPGPWRRRSLAQLAALRAREESVCETLLLHVDGCARCAGPLDAPTFRVWPCPVGRALYLAWRLWHARLAAQLHPPGS